MWKLKSFSFRKIFPSIFSVRSSTPMSQMLYLVGWSPRFFIFYVIFPISLSFWEIFQSPLAKLILKFFFLFSPLWLFLGHWMFLYAASCSCFIDATSFISMGAFVVLIFPPPCIGPVFQEFFSSVDFDLCLSLYKPASSVQWSLAMSSYWRAGNWKQTIRSSLPVGRACGQVSLIQATGQDPAVTVESQSQHLKCPLLGMSVSPKSIPQSPASGKAGLPASRDHTGGWGKRASHWRAHGLSLYPSYQAWPHPQFSLLSSSSRPSAQFLFRWYVY